MESARSNLICEVIQTYIWDCDRLCSYTPQDIVQAVINDCHENVPDIDMETFQFSARVINSTNEELIMESLVRALNRLNQL